MSDRRRFDWIRGLFDWRRLRPYDFVVFLVCAGVATAFSVVAIERSGQATAAEISSDEATLLYALDQDREIIVTGPIGETHIHIEDGRVRFHSSPCRDQICVAAGWMDATGQWAACLPNRTFVTVVGDNDPDLPDATTF